MVETIPDTIRYLLLWCLPITITGIITIISAKLHLTTLTPNSANNHNREHYSSLLVAAGSRLLHNALWSSNSPETRSSHIVQEKQALVKLQDVLKFRGSRNIHIIQLNSRNQRWHLCCINKVNLQNSCLQTSSCRIFFVTDFTPFLFPQKTLSFATLQPSHCAFIFCLHIFQEQNSPAGKLILSQAARPAVRLTVTVD